MGKRRAVDSASDHDLDALRCGRSRHGLFKDGNHAVLAAGVLGVVVVHVRLEIADERRIEEQPLLHHLVGLLLIQSKRVLDRVAAGRRSRTSILRPPAHDNAALRPSRCVSSTSACKTGHRVGERVLVLARGGERVAARREQLDPVGAALDVLADGRARFLRRAHHRAGQWILRTVRRRGAPRDSTAGDLEPGPVESPFVDGVANLDVGVAVAVGTHVARGGEARFQVSLQVLDGDERGGLSRHAGPGRVEHVGMRVNQAGKDRRLRQVDHLGAGRYPDLAFRSDLRDAFALNQHDLAREQLPGVAVEQTAGTDRDHPRGWRTLDDAALGGDTGRRTRAAPGSRRRLHLRPDGHRTE